MEKKKEEGENQRPGGRRRGAGREEKEEDVCWREKVEGGEERRGGGEEGGGRGCLLKGRPFSHGNALWLVSLASLCIIRVRPIVMQINSDDNTRSSTTRPSSRMFLTLPQPTLTGASPPSFINYVSPLAFARFEFSGNLLHLPAAAAGYFSFRRS